MGNDRNPPSLGQTPSVEQIVQEAASKNPMEPALKQLPSGVANALRSMVAGERPAPTLSPSDIAKLGQVIARWGVPYGRSTLGFGSLMATHLAQMMSPDQETSASKPPQKKAKRKKLSEQLIENTGLPPNKAARVEAVALWPIGFTRQDLAHWGLLSEEETEAVWNYILREYGLYTTGTLYAAP